MKKKLFIWMAAAFTALMAAMVSCETPDVGENEDDGNNGDEPANVDVSMTGIWTIDPDAISGLSGLYIHQFRINEDGTGEVLYVDLNDTEFLYDYTVKLTVKEDDNSLEFTIDDVTPETKVSVKYQLDEQNRLNLAFGDAGTAFTYIKAEEWGDFGLTTVFTGRPKSVSRLPSIRARSALPSSCANARFMARNVACRILISSISCAVAMPMPQAKATRSISSRSA